MLHAGVGPVSESELQDSPHALGVARIKSHGRQVGDGRGVAGLSPCVGGCKPCINPTLTSKSGCCRTLPMRWGLQGLERRWHRRLVLRCRTLPMRWGLQALGVGLRSITESFDVAGLSPCVGGCKLGSLMHIETGDMRVAGLSPCVGGCKVPSANQSDRYGAALQDSPHALGVASNRFFSNVTLFVGCRTLPMRWGLQAANRCMVGVPVLGCRTLPMRWGLQAPPSRPPCATPDRLQDSPHALGVASCETCTRLSSLNFALQDSPHALGVASGRRRAPLAVPPRCRTLPMRWGLQARAYAGPFLTICGLQDSPHALGVARTTAITAPNVNSGCRTLPMRWGLQGRGWYGVIGRCTPLQDSPRALGVASGTWRPWARRFRRLQASPHVLGVAHVEVVYRGPVCNSV